VARVINQAEIRIHTRVPRIGLLCYRGARTSTYGRRVSGSLQRIKDRDPREFTIDQPSVWGVGGTASGMKQTALSPRGGSVAERADARVENAKTGATVGGDWERLNQTDHLANKKETNQREFSPLYAPTSDPCEVRALQKLRRGMPSSHRPNRAKKQVHGQSGVGDFHGDVS